MKRKVTVVIAAVMALAVMLGVVPPMSCEAKGNITVLMIGNSMVKRDGNTTVSNLKAMASNSGKSLTIERVTHSNEKMKNWANPKNKYGKKAYKAIAKRKWDYIILQEQTDSAIAHGGTFVKSSRVLAKYIKKKCPDAQIIYLNTWAYDKTKKISGKSYSHASQQKRMDANYAKAAAATGGRVCKAGTAFRSYRSAGGTKNLYAKDKNHASKYGWYLSACCLYSAMFHESPEDTGYYAGLNKTQALSMMRIAAELH